MKFTYDSWDRIQEMTYPDGEVVRYGYNCGGMLKSVSGNKNGVPSRYIDSIRYNEFELKDTVWYGNGTLVAYTYDSLQRLSRLRSHDGFNSLMQDITYTFDPVGNITNIANSATMLPNGLGGTFSQSFSYDNLYRLTGSSGAWRGSDSMYYHSETDYFANGRIMRKQLNARTLINRFVSQTSYNNIYYYENSQQPNTLSRISALEALTPPGLPYRSENDRNSSSTQQFFWDRNGNLARHNNEQDGLDRRLCWDEQNRLQGVADENYLSYYQYDANGDRTYKLTGRGDLQNISGGWHRFYTLDNATLYASPYLVANRQGYTKHYYAESERIASKIGGGGLAEFNYPLFEDDSLIKKIKSNNRMIDKVFAECLDVGYFETTPVLNPLYDWQDSVRPENNCYWYHPDHLGSTSWITYTDGRAVQHLHYLPWGEDYVNQRLNDFDGVRYTFSAKEKDTETGYSYFGSRYYSSDLSIWLSVDPMSDKYPSLSPYAYCNNNPILIKDPNGEDGVITIKNYKITISANVYLYGKGATRAVANQMQADVNKKWGGSYSAKSANGTTFEVSVKVKIKLYQDKEKSSPVLIPQSWNPFNRDNFIEVTDDDSRSYVKKRDEGKWRSHGRNGKSLAQDDPAPHEVGHLLGLGDRYTDENGVDPGWEGNIMGDSGDVDQRNIDGILKDAMNKYNEWIKDPANANKEFRYEINTSNPSN